MTNLDIVIKEYLETPKTDYAIMINGEWGCGKSHYLHHEFIDLIEGIIVPKDGDTIGKEKESQKWFAHTSNEEETYTPAFISLYGVSSVEDFEYKVFCGINEWAENKLFRVASLLGSKWAGTKGISTGKGDFGAVTFINKKKVLVFDDLERICEERISVKEILGLINSFSEHSHLKVIIVCNEKDFLSLDEWDGKPQSEQLKKLEDSKREEYTKYKEKSVRFTYDYIPNVSAVYDEMVKGIKDSAYNHYLSKNKESILSIFRLGGKKNLRTLKFFLDTFGKIYNATGETKYRDSIVNSFMVTFMLYACESKRGVSGDDLESLDMSKYKIDTQSFLGLPRDNQQEESKDRDYLDVFRERYSDVLSEFKPNDSLIEYIVTGYLDARELRESILSLDKEVDRMVIKDEGRVYQKLLRMSELEDTDVTSLIAEMLQYVKEDRYNLYDLLNVYVLLLKYDYWAINGFELTDELDGEFLAAIDRQKDNHKYYSMFEVRTPIWDSSESDQRQYEKYKKIKNAAMGINWQAKNANDKSEGERFLMIAEKGDVVEMRKYRDKEALRLSVSGFDWARVMNIIKNFSNPVACELCNCLLHFMSYSGFLKPDERDRVEKEFMPALNKYLEQNNNRIRDILVRELRDHLEEVLHRP